MASDLPEARHENGAAMARVLVTYIDDPARIQALIHGEFGNGAKLSLTTIQNLRAAHLRKVPADPPYKLHEGHDPTAAARKLEDANKRFLAALTAERELSEQRRAEAFARDTAWLDHASTNLHSSYLTNPRLVDAKWDKTVDDAWWEAGR